MCRAVLHKKAVVFLLFALLLLSITSCASNRDFSRVDERLVSGNFSAAVRQLENEKSLLYRKKDQVLYALDSGMLSHFAGDYAKSNFYLSKAETLIEMYFSKSVSQAIGSFIINDTVIDYAGEDYEDIYVNLFMALNYIHMGKMEDAFVEIRRFDNKLKRLASKYTGAIEKIKQEAAKKNYTPSEGGSAPDFKNLPALKFHNSALARYVSLLLYRSIGQMDAAAIDRKYINSAFSTQTSLYNFPVPAAVGQEFSIPAGQSRLNVVSFAGQTPIKTESVISIPGLLGGSFFKLALPLMVPRKTKTASVRITATNAEKQSWSEKLELLENIENIALDTFQQRYSLLYAKSLSRALAKTIGSTAITATIASQEKKDEDGKSNNAGFWAGLFHFAASIFIDESERADLRISRYFPAQVWVGGLNLTKGVYSVNIQYYDKSQNLLYEETKENIQISESSLSILESICVL